MTERDPDRYLERIGLERDVVANHDYETLARLQSAHARAVPFETLSITGDPYGDYDGEPIELSHSALYEKLIERERGGFCYELNGGFAWLLEALGFDVQRCAARVADGEGEYGVPADHLTLIVTLEENARGDHDISGDDGVEDAIADDERRFLVDVGMGAPVVRRPIPLDGDAVANDVGVNWRLTASGRPDADYQLEYWDRAEANDPEWTSRYILRDKPRELGFFAATCEYHSTSPDSHFTGDPIAMRPTPEGHVTLSTETLTRTVRGAQEKQRIEPGEYRALLADEIGIRPGAD